MQVAGPTAALAGVPAGIQGAGPWLGRRQLFVRFAAEAETATMFTAAALAQEIRRLVVKHDGVGYALERAHGYTRTAKAALDPLPASEDKDTLLLIADYVVDRDW